MSSTLLIIAAVATWSGLHRRRSYRPHCSVYIHRRAIAQPRRAADCLQPPLRSGFRQQLTPGVRRFRCLEGRSAIQSETWKSTSLSGQRTELSTLPDMEYTLKRSKKYALAGRWCSAPSLQGLILCIMSSARQRLAGMCSAW